MFSFLFFLSFIIGSCFCFETLFDLDLSLIPASGLTPSTTPSTNQISIVDSIDESALVDATVFAQNSIQFNTVNEQELKGIQTGDIYLVIDKV